jgi:hypothetical protein
MADQNQTADAVGAPPGEDELAILLWVFSGRVEYEPVTSLGDGWTDAVLNRARANFRRLKNDRWSAPYVAAAEALRPHLLRALAPPPGEAPAEDAAAEALAREILSELRRARAKFPGDNVTTLALVEEVGELAKATFEEPRVRVRKEAVQVATMAMRVVLDGDATLEGWRRDRGLDALVPRDPAAP